ncbi:BMA-GAP-3 [Dirofilaria immitis]|nr:BMA-GAP-3 [Dirofilaria immitis]
MSTDYRKLRKNDKNVKPEELPYFHDEPINVLTKRLTQCNFHILFPNSYTLMVNTGAHIEKFQIKRTSDGNFEIGGRIFATIPDIIERYSEKEICEGFHLMRAVLTSTFESDLSEKMRIESKEDKWKRCYVILNDSNVSQLYVLDHEKRAKPKVVLDLSFCFVYKIPEGSFDRANCLLVASNSLGVYPSHSPSPFAVIPAIQDYFIRSTTVIYLTLTSFRYIPPGPCSLKLELCSHNSLSTRTRAVIFRDYLQKDVSPFYALADDSKELCVEDNFEGFVFRAVRHRIVLLPEEQYASFFVLLTTRSFILSTWVGSILDIFKRKYFARLLLSVLLPNYDLLMSFVEVIVREQIKHETVLRMIGKDLVTEELANLTEGPPKRELEIMNALKSLSEHLPLLFRAILSHIIKTTKAYFNDSQYIARRIASVFFILRFVNPILTLRSNGYGKSTRSVRLMADLLDAVALSPPKVESSENPFCGYSKIDQLALLAFQVEQVLEQQDSANCPLPEAYTPYLHLPSFSYADLLKKCLC